MRFCRRSSLAALLVVLLLAWAAQPAHAAIAILSTCGTPSATPGPDCPTTGINTTGATLLVAINGTNAASCPSGGSPAAGTWTQVANVTGGGFSGTYTLCYINNPTNTGAGQTFACGGTLCGATIMAYSGTDTGGPLDGTNFCTATGGSSPLGCAGSLTPSANGALIVAGTGGPVSTQVSLALDSSLTAEQKVQGTGGVSYGADIGDYVQPTAAAIQPKWDDSAHDVGVIVVAVFKEGGGAPPPTPRCGSGILLRGVGCEVLP